jgi:hypothetical protein
LNEREKARLFNLAVINIMVILFAGFLHMLLLSPQRDAVAALGPVKKELGEKKDAAAKEAAEFKKAREKFKDEVLELKEHFRKNFAEKNVERVQNELTVMSHELKNRFFNVEFNLKKIYFIEALEVKASFKAADPKKFLDFIERARARFYLASKTISMNEFGGDASDISFDFYIPFNAFKIRNMFEGNL